MFGSEARPEILGEGHRRLEELHRAYPRALIVGHHDLNPQKACPCYSPVTEYADLQPK